MLPNVHLFARVVLNCERSFVNATRPFYHSVSFKEEIKPGTRWYGVFVRRARYEAQVGSVDLFHYIYLRMRLQAPPLLLVARSYRRHRFRRMP